MEVSNVGMEITNLNKDATEQPSLSPVPDLVTSVPDMTTTASKSDAALKNSTLAATAMSGSTLSVERAPPGPAEIITNVKPPQPTPAPPHPNPDPYQPMPVPLHTIPYHPTPIAPRATSLPSAASETSVKNRTSREEKARKKDDKSVDHVLRALNSLNTTEEKLAAMCKKYADLFDEHRKLQLVHKQTDKKCGQLQREKEVLQADHNKAILTRSRLENLCRELQRQSKALKEESLLKIREEEEKRKEVSAKFQATMNEITTLMQQNNDNNLKLRGDNIDMTSKLKSICEQYEVRQQQVERISKQMQLEQELADAKFKKLSMQLDNERSIFLQEKQQILLELQDYQQRCKEFQDTEINLRSQISIYNDKYDEFQKALARSNEVFGGFKGEMEKMSKKICKLEKETSSWKQRWERSHNALLEMAADKQRSEQDLSVVSRQLITLQGLCRTLQTERASLMSKLRAVQGGLESIDKPSVEKCTKQCETVNCMDQPANQVELSVNHLDQPANCVMKNDPVLIQYNQDILASFKEAVEAENQSAAAESGASECTKPTMQTSPLPDVVGAATTCVKPDSDTNVNSALCDRLDSVSLNPSSLVSDEKSSVETNSFATTLPDTESKGPTNTTTSMVEESTNPLLSPGNGPIQQSVTAMNGDALTNGVSVKGSPSKSSDGGKKPKESSKKKKKQ